MRKPFNGYWPITQTFGNKLIINGLDVYAQYGLLGHNGIDYGLITGTAVVAPHPGRILEKSFDANGYGNYVKIESDSEGSVLGHLLSISVNVGDFVDEGQIVGLSNNTGNSTGPHLHWGYYKKPRDKNNGYNGFIDQTPFLIGDDIIAGQMPSYLSGLFHEYGLDPNNEGAVREFFGKARSYDSLKVDKENCEAKVIELQESLKQCRENPASGFPQTDYSIADLVTMLLKKLFNK